MHTQFPRFVAEISFVLLALTKQVDIIINMSLLQDFFAEWLLKFPEQTWSLANLIITLQLAAMFYKYLEQTFEYKINSAKSTNKLL